MALALAATLLLGAPGLAAPVTTQVYGDLIPPKVVSAMAMSDTIVDVTFDEAVDTTTIVAGNFAIAGLTVSGATPNRNGSGARLATSAQASQSYTVVVTGVKDMAGNTVDPAANSATFTGLAGDPMVSLSPSSISVGEGGSFSVELRVSHVGDLYGVSADIQFDPAILQVTSYAQSSHKLGTVAVNQFDNAAGTLSYAETKTGAVAGISVPGEETIATLYFKALARPGGTLNVTRFQIADSTGAAVPGGSAGATVSVTQGFQVTGTAQAQGLTDQSNIRVFLSGQGGVVQETKTAAHGSFSFSSVLGGDYRVLASEAGFLTAGSAQFTLNSGNPAQNVALQLLAGDVNSDNVIDIFDIVLIARAYNQPAGVNLTLDLNRDGTIELLDIVLAAINYGKSFSI